jgi:hypothetical protein
VYVAVEANGVPWQCGARFDVAARNRRAKSAADSRRRVAARPDDGGASCVPL